MPDIHSPKKLSAPHKDESIQNDYWSRMQESGFHGYTVNNAEILISFFFSPEQQ